MLSLFCLLSSWSISAVLCGYVIEALQDKSSIFSLFFLQDGSYSRGPVDIPVGEVEESEYYLSPTYKFEQVGSNL